MFIAGENCPLEDKVHFKDGKGVFHVKHLVSEKELQGHGTLYAEGTLKPGDSVGNHLHQGTTEICYFTYGECTVIDNGVVRKAKKGDVHVCLPDETHEIINDSEDDVRYIALVLKA